LHPTNFPLCELLYPWVLASFFNPSIAVKSAIVCFGQTYKIIKHPSKQGRVVEVAPSREFLGGGGYPLCFSLFFFSGSGSILSLSLSITFVPLIHALCYMVCFVQKAKAYLDLIGLSTPTYQTLSHQVALSLY